MQTSVHFEDKNVNFTVLQLTTVITQISIRTLELQDIKVNDTVYCLSLQ